MTPRPDGHNSNNGHTQPHHTERITRVDTVQSESCQKPPVTLSERRNYLPRATKEVEGDHPWWCKTSRLPTRVVKESRYNYLV
ncbi:hypothetical protein TNCV_103991 [Trichonephila clavipes]|nr:hypothetical protein TNCV_103991 [Trichonephila clavipes]